MKRTTGEIRTNSFVTFSYGLQHMVITVWTDQQELRFIWSVRTLDAIYSSFQVQWMIGKDGQPESKGISEVGFKKLQITSLTIFYRKSGCQGILSLTDVCKPKTDSTVCMSSYVIYPTYEQ